jgi:hypothetical protein
MGADEGNMAFYDLVRHKPSRALPVLILSILSAAAFGLFIGDDLVPAMMQLSLGG